MSWTFALAIVLSASGDDPRPEILQHRLDNRPDLARVRVERELKENPESARDLGLDYLLGVLLEEQGQRSAADEAFSRAMTSTPLLAAHGRYHLARGQAQSNHPEIAAGLVASLLDGRISTPRTLVPKAVDLFAETIKRRGDCRLLSGIQESSLPVSLQRRITSTRAHCERRAGRNDEALRMQESLLDQSRDDDIARRAVDWLALRPTPDGDAGTMLLVGLTLHQHGEHRRASFYLQQGLSRAGRYPTRILGSRASESEARYALARAHFRLGDYEVAANHFDDFAQRTRVPEERARALYQKARSQELMTRWTTATATYIEAFRAEPQGSWSAAALLSAMRLHWLSGREEEALELYQRLLSRTPWRALAVRAALFLAASDLVQERTDRADGWLELAESDGAEARFEADYWRGRYFELQQRPNDAVGRYLRVLHRDLPHPIGQAAQRRLAGPLAEASAARLSSLAKASGGNGERDAWLLALTLKDPSTQDWQQRLERRWRQNAAAAPFLAAQVIPVEQWPLWNQPANRPEDLLLGLGQIREGAAALATRFPARDPSLLLTGSYLLFHDGDYQGSVRRAEIFANAIPDAVPTPLYPEPLQRFLYPDPYAGLLVNQSARFRTDPNLLRAIMREESRFDAKALSSASARGLTQFVMPTAQSLSQRAGFGRLRPEHLYRPEVSITLGAAYLDQLRQEMREDLYSVVAAYNAGEDQAHLWKNYCFSDDPAEYYTKVGFRETRGYLRKVLSSHHHYKRLYGAPPDSALSRPPRSLAVAGKSP